MTAGRTISRLSREPLVHFVGAAALLFAARACRGSAPSAEVIVVDSGTLASLERAREELLLRPLTEEEREELVSGFIDEEILLREAYQAGLDRSDPRIRRWLVDRMQFILDEEPPEPTRAELEARFRDEPERYATPLALSFDHVFYPTGVELPDAPERILERLERGDDFEKLGFEFWLGPTLRRFSHRELASMLGKEFVDRVAALPIGAWSGPLPSSRGVHFVRLAAKHEPELPAFDDVAWAVEEDLLREKREESLERRMKDLRTRYRVEILTR